MRTYHHNYLLIERRIKNPNHLARNLHFDIKKKVQGKSMSYSSKFEYSKMDESINFVNFMSGCTNRRMDG